MKSLNACRAGSIVALFVLLHLTAFQVLAADAPAAAPAEPASAKSFDDQLVQANVLFKQGKLDEALAAAAAAGKLDPKRFEAPATAALILNAAHKPEEAKAALDEASALAPTDKQDKIRKIAALLASTPTASTPEVGVASTNAPSPAQLTGAARRQYDTLTLIIEDADKAALDADRKRLLREFMGKGAEFIVEHPLQTNVWVLRAAVALELDYTVSGWLAGRRLKELGAEESDDPKVRKVLAMLDRKGWLNNSWKWHDWSKLTTDQVRRLAEDGDEEAQGALGDWFREGRCGLRKDDAEAANWYRRGAEQGHAYSQTQLGLYYMSGRGVEKDAKEAVKWWRKAAEQGSMWAQFNLGTAYNKGEGIAKEPAEADRWYRRAAEQGNAAAQNNLAWLLATSPDEQFRNGKEAVRWAAKVCESTQSTNVIYRYCLETRAAAHAEVGDFEQAVKYARMAIKAGEGGPDRDFIINNKARLKLYEASRPYHQSVESTPAVTQSH